MPRARVMWPEHRAHRKVGTLTDSHYRLWVGLIMEADDDGRVLVDAFELRAKVFPFRTSVTVGGIKTGIRQLAKRRLIRLYQRSGIHYAYFPSWRDWQHPKYPSPSKLPAPPKVADDSPTTSTPLRQRSPSGSPRVPPVRSGVVRSRKGSNGVGRSRSRTMAHAIKTTAASMWTWQCGRTRRTAAVIADAAAAIPDLVLHHDDRDDVGLARGGSGRDAVGIEDAIGIRRDAHDDAPGLLELGRRCTHRRVLNRAGDHDAAAGVHARRTTEQRERVGFAAATRPHDVAERALAGGVPERCEQAPARRFNHAPGGHSAGVSGGRVRPRIAHDVTDERDDIVLGTGRGGVVEINLLHRAEGGTDPNPRD